MPVKKAQSAKKAVKAKSESSNENAMLEKMSGTYQITITLNGKDYECVSPAIIVHAAFYGKVRNKTIKVAGEYLKTLLSAGVSEQLAVDRYDAKVRDAKPSEFEIFSMTNSVEGARYYFYECAKKNNPELTEAIVEGLITEDSYQDVIRQINTLSPAEDLAKNEARGTEKD